MPVATIQAVIVTPSDLVGSGLGAALQEQYHRVRSSIRWTMPTAIHPPTSSSPTTG